MIVAAKPGARTDEEWGQSFIHPCRVCRCGAQRRLNRFGQKDLNKMIKLIVGVVLGLLIGAGTLE